MGALDRVEAGQQVVAAVGVHHAVGEVHQALPRARLRSRSASSLRSNSSSARRRRAPSPSRFASAGSSRSAAPGRPGRRGRPGGRTGRRRAPRARAASHRCSRSPARPAANVSNSLFGELVASTGTSLNIVRHASEAAASRAADSLSPPGSSSTLPSASPAHLVLDRRPALALALEHERHAVLAALAQQRRGLHHLGQVVGLAHRAEVGRHERVAPARAAARRSPGSTSGENRSRSEALGISVIRSRGTPAAATPSRHARRERHHVAAAR